MKRIVKLTAAGLVAASLLAGSALAEGIDIDPNGAPTATSSSGGFFGSLLNWFSSLSRNISEPDG